MKNYLSFGGGVNSVALYLNMLESGTEFEALFVDHGADWPETYEYVEMFKAKYPLIVVKPKVAAGEVYFDNIYDWCHEKKMFPNRVQRWCTDRFKRRALNAHQDKNCFVNIGYDWGERHRAKIFTDGGREMRFPLIEAEIDREGCKKLIKRHGLPVPPKSGCYICPFQRVGQLRLLRKVHPDLFCKLERLENRNNEYRAEIGYEPFYSFRFPVREVAERNINQMKLWEEDEYPPCECML